MGQVMSTWALCKSPLLLSFSGVGFLETGTPLETEQLARACYTHKEQIKSGSVFTQYMFIPIMTTVSAKHTHTKTKFV